MKQDRYLSMKVICILNETVCNEKEKWNKNECRYECLATKNCDDDFVRNVSKCECEYRKKQQN